MARVIAVAFQEFGTLHYLDVGDAEVSVGEWVLHPTPDGDEPARCVWGPEEVDEPDPVAPRWAGPADGSQVEQAAARRAERSGIIETVKQAVADHELAMDVLAVDNIDHDDGSRLVAVYYRSTHRVDFRALVPDLAGRLRARVDMRQVSGRNPARLAGGVGVCGRELCCTSFLDEPEAIGMRLAADQGYASNPLAVTGVCGKLMCCLRYEHPYYVDFNEKAPRLGETVETPSGTGPVVGRDPASGSVEVAVDGRTMSCPLVSVCTTAARRRSRDENRGEARAQGRGKAGRGTRPGPSGDDR